MSNISRLTMLLLLLGACEPSSQLQRQVVGLAPLGQDNHLLQVDTHISLTPRPEEHYPFPIPLGAVGPATSLYSGRHQYPFYCMTQDEGLGDPLIDNQAGHGVAIYSEQTPDKLLGYSKDCLTPTRVDHFYASGQDNRIFPYDRQNPPPREDIASVELNGKTVAQIFRLERGSINRYLYYIAMLVPETALEDRLNHYYWNGKLLYQFMGGASIGFRQGALRSERFISRRRAQLAQGFAVVGSSANDTSNGYNMLLAEDTARRVKAQFTSLYGDPLYTLGIGGSGGALSQYLIAQNSRGILDGLMPLYSYADMVSQSTFILDCDLLQHYFNITARSNSRWQDWQHREQLEGMHAMEDMAPPYALLVPLNQLLAGVSPSWPRGSSECVSSWFTSASFFYNPHQGFIKPYFAPEVQENVHWTYWENLMQIYGRDAMGYARTTWGNEGVQYGLRALRFKILSVKEFIHLNHHIGAWQPQHRMQAEKSLSLPGIKYPLWLSLWSRHNITRANSQGPGTPAPRRATDAIAVAQAYRYGQIFVGKLELPILEIRPYLEDELNMHHSLASFEARLRLQAFQGHSDNQVIWISHQDYTPIEEGVAFMDTWLMARRSAQDQPSLASKPLALQDACFGPKGLVLAQGETVWDGDWNGNPAGACSRHYPSYRNARIQAGGPWSGSIFKCALMPVKQAIKTGLYGEVDITPYLSQLEAIFPTGVCDYSQGDSARPDLGQALQPNYHPRRTRGFPLHSKDDGQRRV